MHQDLPLLLYRLLNEPKTVVENALYILPLGVLDVKSEVGKLSLELVGAVIACYVQDVGYFL
jgi:hypothetical protein